MLLLVLLTSLALATGAPKSATSIDDQVHNYLLKFGYLPRSDSNVANLMDEHQIRNSIKKLQRYGGIPESGEIDAATKKLMATPRCGLPDFTDSEHERRRSKRFSVYGQKWDHLNLTWSLRTDKGHDKGFVRRELYWAFQVWANHSKLTFQEIDSDEADILIYFYAGEHGDVNAFDGENGVLAHAFPPGSGSGGDVHFDDEERWLLYHNYHDEQEEGTSLYSVAIHELGHSLGLGHSQTQNSVMFAFYRGPTLNIKELPEDDRVGIQQLYGAPEGRLWTDMPKRVTPTPRTTTSTVPTPTTSRPWRYRPTTPSEHPRTRPTSPSYYPGISQPDVPDYNPKYKPQQDRPNHYPGHRPRPSKPSFHPSKPGYYPERPNYEPQKPSKPRKPNHVPHHPRNPHIHHTTGATTISGSTTQYWTPPTRNDVPDRCNTNFDAISVIRTELFIFKGQYFWRIGKNGLYNEEPSKTINMFELPKTTDHVDAVYERSDGKIIFFIGKLFYAFNGNKLMPGYPKPLWSIGLPETLDKIDGAMVWGHNGATYFFSGKEYWRFDETKNHVELDYPRDMKFFTGLDIGYNIDATFQWTNGKTYFFKDRGYWEFDDLRMIAAHKRPKHSASFWLGCPKEEEDTNEIDREIPKRRFPGITYSSSKRKEEATIIITLSLTIFSVLLGINLGT